MQAISHVREHAKTQGGASTSEGESEGVGESACNDNMACGGGGGDGMPTCGEGVRVAV